MNFWSALVTHAFLPLIALSFGFTIIATYPNETLFWMQDKSWLPYPLLVIAAAVTAQFNQSRFFYVILLWLVLLLGVDSPGLFPVQLESVTLLIPLLVSANCLILCQSDKGLRLPNILLTLLLIAVTAGSILLLMEWEALLNHPTYHQFANLYRQVLPVTSAHFSVMELSLYTLISLIMLLRLARKPQLSHTMLALSMALLVLVQIHPTAQLIQFAAGICAVIAVITVLLTSHAMAFKDELTEIPSRRALMHYTKSLLGQYTVVMADVDHFKAFNDKYGHDVGDQVLRMVANQLHRGIRGGKAFRYGGEEFTLVFPGKDPHQVFEQVDQLRESIASYQMVIRNPNRPKKKPEGGTDSKSKQTKQETVQVTMSFGAALKDKQTPFERALKISDQALYKAKKAGRNNVQIG